MDVALEVDFCVITCGSCGVVFAITDLYDDELRRTHKTFYCPNGCRRHYPQKTREEKLREQLQRQKDVIAAAERSKEYWRESADRSERCRRAQKAATTRAKNRLAKGECPCCEMEFADLKAHMKEKHPEYGIAENSQKVNA
jgi:hypothetical protein